MIREVARRWRMEYPDKRYGTDKLEVGRKLEALDGETATAEQVNSIIGNEHWTTPPYCRECQTYKDRDGGLVVQLGDEPDYYDSNTTWVCLPCLKRAVELAESAGQEGRDHG